MMDELDLSFDEYERARFRHARPRGKKSGRKGRKGRRGRSSAALLFTLLLLGVLALGGWYGFGKVQDFLATKDYSGAGDGLATVQVAAGDSATDIANTLYDAQVVKSAKAFVNAANANRDSQKIEPGQYKLHQHMKAALALQALLARDAKGVLANKVSSKVTIPEGMITLDVYATLAKATNIPVADFVQAAKDPIALGVPDWWFKRQDNKPVPTPPSLEGFLYPATYEFDPGSDAKTILKTMVQQFLAVTGQMQFADTVQSTLHISPYEALIAASIAQVEAIFPQDMGGVSRVLYNRAYTGNFPCSCLGLDSEVNYWLRISGKTTKDSGALTNSEIHDPKDPYNTHDKPGLPIGPISNPGKEALTGAMSPPKGGFYYFLAVDTAGHTAFATTYADFCAKTRQAKTNGVAISTCSG